MTRGPGSAPLTWGEQTPELLSEMQTKSLPPPRNFDEAMQLLGTARTAPTSAPIAEGVRDGATGAGVTGEAIHRRRLHPRHREAVAGFFERP